MNVVDNYRCSYVVHMGKGVLIKDFNGPCGSMGFLLRQLAIVIFCLYGLDCSALGLAMKI